MKLRYIQGIMIDTVDNPGWSLKYNFSQQDYETEYWETFKTKILIEFHKNNIIDDTNPDWCIAMGDESKFTASGGALYLGVLMKIFEQWYDKHPIDPGELPITFNWKDPKEMDNLEWLQWYYFFMCNGDWEHTYGVKITATETGWNLAIDLHDTVYEDQPFESIQSGTGESKYECKIKDTRFCGEGGVQSLDSMIGEFREWVQILNKELDLDEPILGDKYIDPWAWD